MSKTVKLALRTALFGLAFGSQFSGSAQTPKSAGNPPPPEKRAAQASPETEPPAEKANKNIQVLKSLPNSQLLTVMHFMRSSLGVRCDYCHVAENGKYWMDDKPTKKTARRMIQMVFDINRDHFDGRTVVTCNSCHQGHTRPISIPPIGQGAFANTTRDDTGAKPAELPTAEQLLQRHEQAIGGATALENITTRVTKISLLRPRLVNSGTPNAAILNRADTWPVEIYQKAPNKYLAIVTTPDGLVYQGYNGSKGWVKTSSEQREMNPAELVRIKRQANFYRDAKLQEQFTELKVTGREMIGERDVDVLEGKTAGRGVEKLSFDTANGLLARRTLFTETPLGLDPEQTDFEDYREADGVKLPFVVKVSYLDDNHFGTTRKLLDVKQNMPLEDSKFEMPSAQP